MHKTIKRALLIVALLLGAWYFLPGKINSPEECQKIAAIWSEQNQTCEQTTTQKIYENLSSGYAIIMVYPETDIKVKIDKAETVEGVYYLRGHYQKLQQQAKDNEQAVYDRGLLYLNMSKMVILNEQETGLVHYAAPFIINTVGGGVFVYTGLFSYHKHSKKSVHIDSFLLGERIREEKISYIRDHLQVDFKGHAEGQVLTDYASEHKVIYLQLMNNFVNFTEVKRMHSSWDKNNDAINDCESEDSCDHSINYSLPRNTL